MPKVGTVSIGLDADSKNLMAELNKATAALRKFGKRANTEMSRIKYAFNKLRRAAQVFASAFIFVHTIRSLVNLALSIERAEEKVQLLTLRMRQFSNTSDGFARVYQLSQKLGTSLDTTGQGLTRLAISTKKLGLTFSELEKIQENIVILGRAGGTSSEEMRAALIQLSQGMASGRLQGEELRSVLENLPLVAMEIAKELNIDIGKIRQFAAEGKIGAGVVTSALMDIDLALKDLPDTFSMATARMANSWEILKAALGGKVATSPVGQFFTEWAEGLATDLGFFGHLTNDQLRQMLNAENARFLAEFNKQIENPDRLFETVKPRLQSTGQRADGLEDYIGSQYTAPSSEMGESLALIKAINAELRERGDLFVGLKPDEIQALRAAQAEFAALEDSISGIGVSGGIDGFQKAIDGFVELGKGDVQKLKEQRDHLADIINIAKGAPEFAKYVGALEAAYNQLGVKISEAEIQANFENLQEQFSGLQFTLQDTLDRDFQLKASLAVELGLDSYSEIDSLLDKLRERTTSIAEANQTVIGTMELIRSKAQDAGGEIEGIPVEKIDLLLEAMRMADEIGLDAAEGVDQLVESIGGATEKSDAFKEKIIELAYELAALGYKGLTKEMVDKWVANMDKGFDAMEEFAKQAARNIQDAFADFLFDPFDKGLRGMLKSFIDTIRRMIAELIANKILMYLFKEGTPLGDALRSGKRAIGGNVSAGSQYLVGERGPEMFVPNASGTIIPNHRLQGISGATVIQTNNIDARGATQDVIRALPGILAENNKRLTLQLRDNVRRTGTI